MQQRIRVLIADDRPSSRRGLRALLGVRSQIEIVGEAADGRQAVQLVEELEPDVVLMDVSMPVLDGLEATRRIKCRWPEVKVVVLTMYAAPRVDALAAGADSFLVKGCQTEDLLQAISGDRLKSTPDPDESYRRTREGTSGSVPPTAHAWCIP